METPKKGPNTAVNDPEAVDDTSVENSEENAGRRLQDSLISKDPNRKFNVDRRTEGSDRRVNTDPNYTGPARRFNIDRRLNIKDRRKKE